LQPFVEAGAPFEYTLKGIEPNKIKADKQVIELIWQGKSQDEIVGILDIKDDFSVRWRELMELYQAGYQQSFDEALNTYNLVKP